MECEEAMVTGDQWQSRIGQCAVEAGRYGGGGGLIAAGCRDPDGRIKALAQQQQMKMQRCSTSAAAER